MNRQAENANHPDARKAAILLAWIGLVESLAAMVLAIMGAALARLSVEALRQSGVERGLSEAQIENLVEIRGTVGWMIVTVVLLLMTPGVCYFFLARGVRWGRSAAIQLSYLMLMTQAVVAAMMLVSTLYQAVAADRRVMFTAAVLLLGTPLVVMIYTIAPLIRLRRQPSRSKS